VATIQEIYAANKEQFDNLVSTTRNCCFAMLFGTTPSDVDPPEVNLLLGFTDASSQPPSVGWITIPPAPGIKVNLYRFNYQTLMQPPNDPGARDFRPDAYAAKLCYSQKVCLVFPDPPPANPGPAAPTNFAKRIIQALALPPT
jgi:hypothetical protein